MPTSILRVVPLHAVYHHWTAGQEIAGPVGGTCVFWLMTSGSVVVEAGAQRWDLREGEAFLFQITGPRRVFTPHGAQWLSIGLSATSYDSLELPALLPLPAQWAAGEEFAPLLACAEGIARSWGAPQFATVDARTFSLYMQQQKRHPLESDAARALLCSGWAQALFALCWRRLSQQPLENAIAHHWPAWMPKLLAHAHEDPAANIEELARRAGVSRRHLSREFGRCFGMAPRDFFRQRRLGEARRLLGASPLTISAIARQSGFSDAAHFSRAFKAAFGLSPDQFRRSAARDDVVI